MNFKRNNDFSNICRICLNSTVNLISLFANNISNMLNFCEFWKVNKYDGLPQNICDKCEELVLQSYKLKKLCIASKLSLEGMINKEDNIPAGRYINQDSCDLKDVSCQNRFLYVTNDRTLSFSDGELEISNNYNSNGENNAVCEVYTKNDEPICKNNKFLCEICNQNFEFEKDLQIHQSIHSLNMTCNSCKKSFPTIKKLKRHIKTHMKNKSHLCKFCDKVFCETAALNKHVKLHHMGIPRDKRYCCKECGKRFTDKYYLSLHTRKHTGEKPLACTVCEKSFYDPRSLKVHILAHSGNKSYLCSKCGKSFVQSSHLKKHLVVHTNEKSFSCNMCLKKFTQSSSLQRHKKLHCEKYVLNRASGKGTC